MRVLTGLEMHPGRCPPTHIVEVMNCRLTAMQKHGRKAYGRHASAQLDGASYELQAAQKYAVGAYNQDQFYHRIDMIRAGVLDIEAQDNQAREARSAQSRTRWGNVLGGISRASAASQGAWATPSTPTPPPAMPQTYTVNKWANGETITGPHGQVTNCQNFANSIQCTGN